MAVVYSVSRHTSSIQARFGFVSVFFEPFATAEAPYWHHEVRVVGRGEPLKETRSKRRFHDDLGVENDRNEAWRPMSEVVSPAVLCLDSRTYQGKLGEFSLVKNAMGVSTLKKIYEIATGAVLCSRYG